MGEVGLGAAAGEHSLLQQLHRMAEGDGGPAPKLSLDDGLAAKVEATPVAHHHARTLPLPRDPRGEERQGMAQGRAEHHRGVHTLVAKTTIIPLDLLTAADEGGVDQRIEDAAGDIADHRLHIVQGDLRLAPSIERQLLDLGQARTPISTQAHGQDVARLTGDALAILLKRAVDEFGQSPLVIGVAGERKRPRRLLAERPQGRALGEVSRLHHDASPGDVRLQGRIHRRGIIAASGPYPDAALAAEQADRTGLVHEPACIRGEDIAVYLDQGEGIGRIGDETLGQTFGALEDEASIRPVDEDDRDLRRGSAPQQGLDIAGLDGGQGLVTRTEAIRVLIWSARVLAKRISASRAARREAKRWIERS